MSDPGGTAENEEDPTASRSDAGYLKQINIVLVVVLTVTFAALAAWGASLRPQSKGFPNIPNVVYLGVPTTELTAPQSTGPWLAAERLTRTQDNGSELDVVLPVDPLHRPQGGWSVTVYNLGTGYLCTPRHFPERYVFMPSDRRQTATKMAEPAPPVLNNLPSLAPAPGATTTTSTVPPSRSTVTVVRGFGTVENEGLPNSFFSSTPGFGFYFRLCWQSGGPVTKQGAYLSARFPLVVTQAPSASSKPNEPVQIVQGSSDEGFVVQHSLYANDGTTFDFEFQSNPEPDQPEAPDFWYWGFPAQITAATETTAIAVAAVNTNDLQKESNDAFLSGLLLGISGGALVGVIAELATPFARKRGG
jgi:hypothetical protein